MTDFIILSNVLILILTTDSSIEFLQDLFGATANCYWKLKGLKSLDIGDKQSQITAYLLYLQWTWEANLQPDHQ